MPFEKKMHKNFETQIFNTKQHTSGQVNDLALPKKMQKLVSLQKTSLTIYASHISRRVKKY